MADQDEIRRLRTARSLGLVPNPTRFTGPHQRLALELERLFARIEEIDKAIYDGSIASLPAPDTQEHVRYIGQYHRGGNFAGLDESCNLIFQTETEAMTYLSANLPPVERSWCTTMPVVVTTPRVGGDVDSIKAAFKHLF